LVPGDTNGTNDVFVHDRETGETTRVSVNSLGGQGNGWSSWAAISADGRFVTFESDANNLGPGDTNDTGDVVVHGRLTGETTRASVTSDGSQTGWSYWGSEYPDISADGRYVAFHSYCADLVPGDTNQTADVFVHDRQTGETIRVSVDSQGGQANSWC